MSNLALHRIAAQWRLLLNLKGLVWVARGERWALGAPDGRPHRIGNSF
jgi:hypothetical protein